MKRAFVSVAFLSTAFVWSMACSDSSPSGPPAGGNDAGVHPSGPPVSATIGSAGGTISAAGAILHVPAGALDHEVSIAITPLADAAPRGYTAHSSVYRFEPEGLQFHVPAEIELQVDGSGAQNQIFWTEPDGHFVGLPSTAAGSTLHANVAHFSRGFAGAQAADIDAGGPDADAGPACETAPRADLLQPKVIDHSIAWNGDGYGVVWSSNDTDDATFFQRLDLQGKKLGDPVRVAAYGFGEKLVWNGNGYGLAIGLGDDVHLLRLDPSGKVLGDALVSSTSSVVYEDLDLAFSGTQYGITWRATNGNYIEIRFLGIDTNGQKIGSLAVLRQGDHDAGSPTITAVGDTYGIAWGDARISGNSEIYFARVSNAGATLGTEVRVTNDSMDSGGPRVVWTGTQYGIFYSESTSAAPQARFVRLDAGGQKIGDDILVAGNGSSYSPTLDAAWTGSGYDVVFSQSDGVGLYRVSADGSSVGPRSLLGAGLNPSMAWTGTGLRTIWYVPNGQYEDLMISPALCP